MRPALVARKDEKVFSYLFAYYFPPQTKSGFHDQGEKETTNNVSLREVSWEDIYYCQEDTVFSLPDPALLSGLTLGSVENTVKISSSNILQLSDLIQV